MRLKGVLVLLLSVSVSYGLSAQRANDMTQPRVLILLDGSSSMTQPWQSGKLKWKAASNIILKLMDSVYAVNNNVEFGLRVFGHQYTVPENNCYDTRVEVPFKKENRLQMEYRLADIKPLGVTSIAYSLKQAALNDLLDLEHNVYSIVLITDGGESCGGNICEVMQMLLSKKVYFKPYIVSLEDYPELKKEYDCMGEYLQVTKDAEISKAVGTIVDAFRPALKLTQTEYKELQTIAAKAPSILKVNVPEIKETPPGTETKSAPPAAPAWMKPAVEKIDNLVVKLKPIIDKAPAQQAMKPVMVPGMPDVVPEPVKPAAESIPAISLAGLYKFNSSIASISRLRSVQVPEMPEIAPEPVKAAPENITRIDFASSRMINIPDIEVATPRAISYAVIEMPEVVAEPIRPAPESIGRLDVVKLRKLDSSAVTIAWLNRVKEPSMPEIAPEPEKPAAENIDRIVIAKLHKLEEVILIISMLEEVSVPGMPAIEPEPVKPSAESIERMATSKLATFNTSIAVVTRLRNVQVPDMPEIVAEPVKPAAESIDRVVTVSKLGTFNTPPATTAKLKTVQVPEMPEIAAEPVKPVAESIDRIGASKLTIFNAVTPTVAKLKTVQVPVMPEIVPEFTKPVEEQISGLTPARLAIVETKAPVAAKLKANNLVIPMPELVVENPPPPPTPPVERLQTAGLKRVNIIWVFDDRKLTQRTVPPMPDIKIEQPPAPVVVKPTVPTKPGTKPALAQPEPTGKKMDFTVTADDAQETSLEVFFTNGKGLYYQSTPQMLMMDPKTQAIAKKFYRTVDASGNPDPQMGLAPGTYDLTFSAKRSLVAYNIKIEPNKKNRVTIKVPNPQLSFVYAEPNNFTKVSSRPVKEFAAVVIERNKVQGRVQQQKCTEVVEYEPGNYHVKLNTFPEDMRNLDLEFEEKIITIAQPGFAKFTNSIGARVAGLYTRVGDKFLQFFTLDLSRAEAQHLQMQPGEYQVHYQKGPGGAMTEKVKSFIVKSVQDTEVVLE